MYVGKKDEKKFFKRDGLNYGYMMNFECVPENNYIELYMICYNSKYFNKIRKEAKILLNL